MKWPPEIREAFLFALGWPFAHACILGKKFMRADNVISVDIIDAMTGEIIENWND